MQLVYGSASYDRLTYTRESSIFNLLQDHNKKCETKNKDAKIKIKSVIDFKTTTALSGLENSLENETMDSRQCTSWLSANYTTA